MHEQRKIPEKRTVDMVSEKMSFLKLYASTDKFIDFLGRNSEAETLVVQSPCRRSWRVRNGLSWAAIVAGSVITLLALQGAALLTRLLTAQLYQ